MPTAHATPNLRWLRTHRALTQHQLAKVAGVARSTIGLLEGGKESGMPTLAKLARALGVEPAELMDQPRAYVLKWPRNAPAPNQSTEADVAAWKTWKPNRSHPRHEQQSGPLS
jgi:transcriptional regulator with XRE-family HTH domain